MQQKDDNQKNLLLAIVLSIAVLLGWQIFYANPKLKEEQERRQRIQKEQQAQVPQSRPGTTTSGTSGAPAQAPEATPSAPSISAAATQVSREAALAQSPRIAIETPSLKGSIALKGALIDDLVLVKFHEQVDPRSDNVVLFSPAGAADAYFAEYGWIGASGADSSLPTSETIWRAESAGPLTPTKPVVLVYDNGHGLVFRRTIAVDDNYLFKLTDEVQNHGATTVNLAPYARIYRFGLPKVQGYYILHEGLIGVLGDYGLKELKYADAQKEGGSLFFKQVKGGWLGITDKYWAAALIPNQDATYEANLREFKGAGKHLGFLTDFTLTPITFAPGATQGIESDLFAGAKLVRLIDTYREQLGAKQFDKLVDWGWFYFITKPLFWLIDWLSRLFGNFGLAILATTVLVKLMFFPLANKSYESMAKMKKLQPEMEKIRERFKDDRQKQQQELMALYQKQKINPAAGCLPMLLQVPVFFALYKVLFVTIDMRHAPFFGWIKDLSAPDPTSIFNLFGLLPFDVPSFLHVGVWPIIMGITMWFQMQLNPQQPDPIQQKIFTWMPVMFTFMLASFPVGLVIYWAWNNVLSLIQQYVIMRKNGAEIHLWKNLGIEKWLNKGARGKT
jgi:YidC/Oxa1 family membrane protein insertase